MMPRTSHLNFKVQMQIHEGKGFPQILYGIDQDKDQRSISLEPGYEYEVELYPYGQMSTEDFKEMSLEKRGCRLNHETIERSTHPVYTKDDCLYDCHVQLAYDVCQCIPWDFVNTISDSSECDIFGRTCFFNVMENTTHSRHEFCSHCVDECDWVKYRKKMIRSESISLKTEDKDAKTKGGKYCNKYICIDSKLR